VHYKGDNSPHNIKKWDTKSSY